MSLSLSKLLLNLTHLHNSVGGSHMCDDDSICTSSKSQAFCFPTHGTVGLRCVLGELISYLYSDVLNIVL